MTLSYSCKPFAQLSIDELYAILRLRQEVFIVEQSCPYLDADGKDIKGYHLMGVDENKGLHGYTRLLPEGVYYSGYTSIGRVINSTTVRGKGYGKELMQLSIMKIKELYPDYPIKIGAQAYLKKFYESFGFVDIGIPYLEDGIPHIIMILV
ncbi:MAG: GNAT family N-acetyltransferase [Saprospiraceae bacterium]|nr:GNAT family N-acetyltransferase [Saprospiraceae bacterium]